ncbi:MAG: single-stranded-DNA-specific exonuclease RecJ [Candidatus Kerfeldbacteria bacterium]|nr:single-stranded-DNA-specific exonuclease RecJ [Candidatus Kerfeldbacteria bacterium]
MPKRWILRSKVLPEIVERLPKIDRVLLQLLYARGMVDKQEIERFLDPDYQRDIHSPFTFRHMQRAVERIARALKNNEKIVVYGDYDADGVCATAILTETLKALGGQPDIYIPFRETEGYGLNMAAVKEIAARGTRLMLTVDCGTTNVAEVDLAQQSGMEVIITDHHDQPPELPRAFALINPELRDETYPYRHLAASGVAFKLAGALLSHTRNGASLGRPALPLGWEKWLLDLVAISTVTDMVPMLGENRVLVRFGLSVLRKTRRVGLRQLVASISSELDQVDEETLAFQVGPRLNAAGRMNHASTAYRLLVTDDLAEAKKLSAELSQTNQERQRTTEAVVNEALSQIGEKPTPYLLVAQGTNWPVGILGLVAGKITDRFNRPTIAMTTSQGRIVGSGRSIEAFDITAALGKANDYLERFGGHPQACGFTVKPAAEVADFIRTLQRLAQQQLAERDTTRVVEVDAEVILDDINWDLVNDVDRLSPFGVGAPRPRFLSRGLRVVAVDTVGKDGQHLRLHVSHATSTVHKTIGFRFGSWFDQLNPGDVVDLVFEVGVNQWNDSRQIELKIIDLDRSALPVRKFSRSSSKGAA